MKGYQINNKLYVFPQEAGELPTIDSEVAVIYVQHEDLAAFKTANEAYADKMVGYNYNTMTVKAKEWAGHTDDDITPAEPEVQTYSITLSQDGEYCHGNWDGNVTAGTACSLTPEAGYSFDQTVAGTILLAGSDQVQLTFNSGTGTMDFTMPAGDVTIVVNIYQTRHAISYEGDATEYVTAQTNGAGGETIVITPNEGYTFNTEQSETATVLGARAFNASDESVELEVTVNAENGTASFTMPEYAVRVTVNIDQDYVTP